MTINFRNLNTRLLLGIVFIILSCSCGQDEINKSNVEENLNNQKDTTLSSVNNSKKEILSTKPVNNWSDSLIQNYISHTIDDSVETRNKDKSTVEWMFDRIEDRETVKYHVFQIGHDVSDEDGKRFVTDQWIYIDSTTNKLYEYDLANDSLIYWKN